MKSVYLAHLGYNMWKEAPTDRIDGVRATDMPFVPQATASYDLRFDEDEWEKIVGLLVAAGCDTILLDIGEGMVYERHPELAVSGSWTKQRLADEISRLRSLGIDVIPKLNFSACHDEWLGIYSRMVSTPDYYRVCQDCIDETAELFSGAGMFHLGMDEETAWHQPPGKQSYMCLRQGDLWWHDIERLFRRVESLGVRPWIWSDYIWHHKEAFLARMPKSVMQSNWYYGSDKIDPGLHKSANARLYTAAFQWLEDAGYDQIPCGSTFENARNFPAIVEWGRTHVPAERLKGFLMTTWVLTVPQQRDQGLKAIQIVANARESFFRQEGNRQPRKGSRP